MHPPACRPAIIAPPVEATSFKSEEMILVPRNVESGSSEISNTGARSVLMPVSTSFLPISVNSGRASSGPFR